LKLEEVTYVMKFTYQPTKIGRQYVAYPPSILKLLTSGKKLR